jgi:hypothetical protein
MRTVCGYLLFFAVLVSLASPPAIAGKCDLPGSHYTLVCRGKISLVTHRFDGSPGQVKVFLYPYKNAIAAGSKGENLKPGACAWEDRPISASEPGEIQWQAAGTLAPGMIMTQVVAGCAQDPTCVFIVCAQNDAALKSLGVMNDFVNTVYPFQ